MSRLVGTTIWAGRQGRVARVGAALNRSCGVTA